MSHRVETTGLIHSLERVVKGRQAIAHHLSQMAEILTQSESDAEQTSGKLGLEREIADLKIASQNCQQGIFRLMVLGDMKRGKSTFLNALIGENLLPSDVNPCTALLTILRYGAEKRVTIHFNDGQPPKAIDFHHFKQQYTIAPEEAKSLEQKQQQAFPGVSHAVVEYPLPLLEHGIEIVDSPGLNDTEARNELSLGYLNNCHAVLFVLRASQPCTLAERRYLENYIKDRGLSVFFLINAWDQIKEGLIDPDDAAELQEAETKLRKVFHTHLADYCQVEGYDLYEERVFEISAITALRRRLKNLDADLSDTGFPGFLSALSTFLTEERAIAELRQTRGLARHVAMRVQEALDRRMPLLNQDVNELKARIAAVEPQFNQLHQIRDQFRDEIRWMRDRQSHAIADSFRTYVLNLETTFEQDFLRYQPPHLQFLELFQAGKRDQFNQAFQAAFHQYVNDKFFAWTLIAERELNEAFAHLSRSAVRYGSSYTTVLEQISEQLTGQKLHIRPNTSSGEDVPGWAKWAIGLFSLASGNIAGAAMAAGGFDFKSILLNFITATGIAIVASSIFGILLGPITFALVGLGVGMMQADHAQKELMKATKREVVKHLPQIAQEQWQPIYRAVQECFDAYEREVIQRINDDIQSRKTELDTLLQQKQSREIHQETEMKRLDSLKGAISAACQAIEAAYQTLLLNVA